MSYFSKSIEPEERVMEILIHSWSIRSIGHNLCLQLKMRSSLVGMSLRLDAIFASEIN
jgi:hypothetical protein